MDTEEEVHQQMISAGWEVDGSFSEHLAIGEAGNLCMIVSAWVLGSEKRMYELYDVSRHISHWVREVPTPEQAAELLNKHGKTPPVEEE